MASPKMKKLNLRMSRNELRDIEFLASVDRFPFVVPAEDIDDQWTDDDDNDSNEMPTQDYYWRPYLNMLDLTQENRGVIKDAFQEGSPCSIHFLRCIKFNLLAMTMDFALSTDKDVIFSRISLDRCNPDLARLYGHPELFPSESMERAFREDVSSICSLFLQIASITEKASGLQQDVFDATEEFVNDMILPVRDKHRKLWQQFLHKNAPGSGIDDSFRREGMATTQVVPLSALELRASMRSERASVFKDLIANDRNPASSQATASTYAKITMENNIRTSWLQFGALPPFPRRPTVLKALATIKGDSTSLEELNVRFNILKDTGRARYRPRILGRATTIIQDEKLSLSVANLQNPPNTIAAPQVTKMQAAPNLAVGATAGQNRAHMATGLKLARPVNSWMAFRSYYSTIFAGLQQKAISVFMTFLWQEEPFKGKWAIIAKAYSKVRDAEGKVNAPFDRFLAISAPFVNLVHPRSYLRTYGYEVGIGMVGHTVLRRKVLTDLRGIVGNLNVGVHDVIRNCYNQGYIPKLIDSVLPTNAVALTMATIAQPTQSSSAAAMANGVVVAGNVNGAGQGFLAANGIGSIFGQAVATNVPAVAGNATGAGQGPLGANGTGTIAGEDELDLNAPIPSPVFPVSGQEMDDAAKRAHLKACAALKGPYPFHANFEPGSETAIYAPHRGDPFDAIEISDLHEFDFDFSDWIIDETRK